MTRSILPRWWCQAAGVLLAALSLTGCRQQIFLSGEDMKHYQALGLPSRIEQDPHATIVPTPTGELAKPSTVLDADRPPRCLPLSEAIALALEQGNVGFGVLNPGSNNDQLVQFTGRTVTGDDAIRVFALDPAISGADIESALSKFDTRWISSLTWQNQDQAVANVLQSFQNGDLATLNTGLFKPLPTGGTAGITFNTDYTKLAQPPQQVVNPSYRPRVQVSFEQPLLQGFGVEINQLTSQHPGSIVNQGLRPSGGTRVEGILITRLRYDQSKAEFERNINTMLYNVEAAYWNLYAAYYALYAREQGIRANYEVYRVNREQLIVGKSSPIEVAQAKGQFESFRVQRLTALGQVLERERQLRGLLGMPIEDGTRLVPTDEPVLAPIAPDWSAAVQTTLAQRPELTLARQDLKFRQLDLLQQKNQLRPDLRTFATYDVNGLGTRLDGRGNIEGGGDTSSEQNALRSMLSNRFHSWQLGLRMDVPIGFRDAQAAVRVSRLNLTRSYLVLKDQELKAERFLGQQYRQLFEANQQIVTQRAARLAAEEEIRTRAAKVIVGIGLYGDLNFFNAVERYSGALANEFQAIASYNTALAGFEFAKGTIMQYDNVTLADGPLPAHAQVRAVEHIRARHAALHVRDREAANVTGPATGLPSLQNLAEHPQPVPAIPAGPEMLPAPQPGAPGVPMVPMPTMPLNGPGGVPRGQVGLEYVPLPPGAVLPAQVPLMVSQ